MFFELLTALLASVYIERILYQSSKAVLSAIRGTYTQCRFVSHVLDDLIKLDTHPRCLTETAYEWCSTICENRKTIEDWESLLLACLEIGFRHLDVQTSQVVTDLTHTEHHKELANIVFKSQKSEAIADLLHARTVDFDKPARALLGSCTEHLVGLHNLVPSSLRLRRFVIRSIECIGYKGFEGVGVERFFQLLNCLCVTVQDMGEKFGWLGLLLETLQCSEAVQHLSHWYWELLVELAISESWPPGRKIPYTLHIIGFLTEAQEWSKLECWIGMVLMVWPLGTGTTTEEDLERSMLLLFRQRPGSVQKLEEWME